MQKTKFMTVCPCCKPIFNEQTKRYESQWTGCPYCHGISMINLYGLVQYLVDLYREDGREIPVRVMRHFGIKL